MKQMDDALIGGFQLEFVSISGVKNHMTCYNSSALIEIMNKPGTIGSMQNADGPVRLREPLEQQKSCTKSSKP